MFPPAPIRDTTFADLFARLSRCARQAILLEARLECDAYDRPVAHIPPHAWSPGEVSASPARTRTQGDGTGLKYERLEDDLAADAHRAPETILAEIGAELDAAEQTIRPAAPPRLTDRPKHLAQPATSQTARPTPPPERRPSPKPA